MTRGGPEGWIWRAVANGFELRVRAQPNASRDLIEGPGEDASGQRFLKVRVRAVPEKGRANAAVTALVAKTLGVPASAVELAAGETARIKRVRIHNVSNADPADIAERLAALCAPH